MWTKIVCHPSDARKTRIKLSEHHSWLFLIGLIKVHDNDRHGGLNSRHIGDVIVVAWGNINKIKHSCEVLYYHPLFLEWELLYPPTAFPVWNDLLHSWPLWKRHTSWTSGATIWYAIFLRSSSTTGSLISSPSLSLLSALSASRMLSDFGTIIGPSIGWPIRWILVGGGLIGCSSMGSFFLNQKIERMARQLREFGFVEG